MLSIKDKYDLLKFIEAKCIKGPDGKHAKWLDGLTDQIVADRFRPSMPNVNVGHIRVLRQEMGLLLEPSRFMVSTHELAEVRAQIDGLVGDLSAITNRTRELETRMIDLMKRVHLLEEARRPKA